MKQITNFLAEFVAISAEMAPYLLFGFLFAGILHVYFPQKKMKQFMGQWSIRSVFNAAIFGIPLPLCSCGVIPTGISFHKNGASKGATVSFLISTPQTGVDSIFVTWSLLGLPFALIRPLIAFVTGVIGGIITHFADPGEKSEEQDEESEQVFKHPFRDMLHYAFVEFLQDISKWLFIGLLIAATVSVVVPDDFFVSQIDNEWLSMLIILVVSIPLYVCATSSVPIAAVLIMKGLSPGAALVFLMAGPATNAATITVIGKSLGKKTLAIYLLSIIGGALFFGGVINEFIPREWFALPGMTMLHQSHESHSILPLWFKYASAVLLGILMINGYIQRKKHPEHSCSCSDGTCDSEKNEVKTMKKRVSIKGMTCNHCKMSVERNLSKLEGISSVLVDLDQAEAEIEGDDINLEKVKTTLDEIGYKYDGER